MSVIKCLRDTLSLARRYILDWIVILIMGGIALCFEFLKPFTRYYFANDMSISYPHKDDTVPSWTLVPISFGVPLVVVVASTLALHRGRRSEIAHLHHALLALLMSLVSTLMLTQIVKVTVGRLRPDFISRCVPEDPSQNNSPCTNKDIALIEEGRKSFFSGHASSAFSGLTFLSFYIIGEYLFSYFSARGFHGTVQNGTQKAKIVRIPTVIYFTAAIPLMFALLIAISRVSDYKHHWQDVLVGSLVGFLFAYFSYNQYFDCKTGNFIFYDSLPGDFKDRFSDDEVLPIRSPSIELRADQASLPGSDTAMMK